MVAKLLMNIAAFLKSKYTVWLQCQCFVQVNKCLLIVTILPVDDTCSFKVSMCLLVVTKLLVNTSPFLETGSSVWLHFHYFVQGINCLEAVPMLQVNINCC